jgi:hypothetical protein
VHKADHSVASGVISGIDIRIGGMMVAEDQEAMMRDFEIGDDEDASLPNSPVTRRTSFPTQK